MFLMLGYIQFDSLPTGYNKSSIVWAYTLMVFHHDMPRMCLYSLCPPFNNTKIMKISCVVCLSLHLNPVLSLLCPPSTSPVSHTVIRSSHPILKVAFLRHFSFTWEKSLSGWGFLILAMLTNVLCISALDLM